MDRFCVECNNPLIKRKFESKKKYSKKKFCSVVCSRAYLKKNKLGWWADKNDAEFVIPTDYEDEN